MSRDSQEEDAIESQARRAPRILSIQSSVVHGYVGNRSATFPLQLHGFDVACFNTVQFSTHTGYPHIHGTKLQAKEFEQLYLGLQENGCMQGVAGLLTGYVPGAIGVQAVRRISEDLLASEQPPLWVLDPVIGDEERGLYVSEEIPPLYRQTMARAHVITPNQFELGVLAQQPVTDVPSLKKALATVHAAGVERVVVTTFRRDAETILVVGSQVDKQAFAVEVPYSDCPFQGTGDLFAALLLARLLNGDALDAAVLGVLASMKPVLQRTEAVFREGCGQLGISDWRAEKKRGKEGQAASVCRLAEVRIIESAQDMLNPPSSGFIQQPLE